MLLRLLAAEESYGWEIVQRLHSSGLDHVKEGTVYPALSRLERDGHLSTRLEASSSGPARRYYRLSTSGHELLKLLEESWDELVATVEASQTGAVLTAMEED